MKAALRTELRRRRRALHAAHPGAGHALVHAFQRSGLPLPAVAAVYRAAGSEIDPARLADWLGAQGVRIVLPVVARRDAPLVFREAVDGPYEQDALGLPAPPAHAPELRPNIVFTPLLGFDGRGGRIGQGGGYYDRTLEELRASGPAVTAIGLAYAAQQVERIPAEPTDQPLDGVLTETGYLSVL